MQVLYKIDVSLSEYYERVKGGTWEFPSYQDRCAICKRSNCAVKDGHYKRPAYDEEYRLIEKLQIQRYLCKTTKAKKGKLATFSLSPKQIYPYRRYSLKIVTYCLSMLKKFKNNIYKTTKTIFVGQNVDESLLGITESHIYQFIKDFKSAFTKYRISKSRSTTDYTLDEFIKDCSLNNYTSAEVLSIEYYKGNGGYIKNSQFLFGTASQFRGG